MRSIATIQNDAIQSQTEQVHLFERSTDPCIEANIFVINNDFVENVRENLELIYFINNRTIQLNGEEHYMCAAVM